jgi:hypothetical protein
VKRSGRDEPMWVAICMCMEAMLGTSLYRYFYPKLATMLCLSYYLLCFLFNKIMEQEGKTGSARSVGREVAQTMYTNVSKHKNNIKKGFVVFKIFSHIKIIIKKTIKFPDKPKFSCQFVLCFEICFIFLDA